MKKLLIETIAQETLKSANNVGVYVYTLQENLDKFLSFETKATRSTHNAELIEIFYQEENGIDDSLNFKVLSFNLEKNNLPNYQVVSKNYKSNYQIVW